jgi:hypothetical protein
MRRILISFFAFFALCGLGFANAWIYWSPLDLAPIADEPGNASLQADSIIVGDKMRTLPDNAISHALIRPLFTSTRRPWVAPLAANVPVPEPIIPDIEPPVVAPPVVAPPSTPPSIAILGLQQIPEGTRVLLSHAGQSDAQWFKPGDIIDEWKIVEIVLWSVRLEKGEDKFLLELYPAIAEPNASAIPAKLPSNGQSPSLPSEPSMPPMQASSP